MKIYIRFFSVAVLSFFLFFSKNSSANQTDFQTAADNTFESLSYIYKNTSEDCYSKSGENNPACNYWQLGSALSTVVDYFQTNPTQATSFVPFIISAYEITKNPKNISGPACWYDDFGWWAVSTREAAQQKELWPDQTKTFSNMASESWSSMQPAVDVWSQCRYSFRCVVYFHSLEPKIKGGVWNYFWSKDKIKGVCNTPSNPLKDTPALNLLAGRQNTVTNALYSIAASQNLKINPMHPSFLEKVLREQHFLNTWFFLNDVQHAQDFALLKTLSSGAKVARERVSLYKDNHVDPVFDKDLVWAGDQGLILGELVSYLNLPHLSNQNRVDALSLAKKIIDGGLLYLTDQNHIYPWSRSENPTEETIGEPPSGDPWDYNLGPAVFLHHLVSAYKSNPVLRDHINSQTHYKTVILNAAENAFMTDDGLCYPNSGKCNHLVLYSNKLALLVAAIEFSEK